MTMPLGGYGAMHIARWSASLASCKATRCRHWASAHAVLPGQTLWLMILNEIKKTKKTPLFTKLSHGRPTHKSYPILRPIRDPLLTSSEQLALTLTLMPLFKLKSLATLWAIKRSKWTKIQKVIKLEQSPRKPLVHICAISG